jgi:hypothetical protein
MRYLLFIFVFGAMQLSIAQSLDKLLAAPNKTPESVGSINPAADTHKSDDDLHRRIDNIHQINQNLRSYSSSSSNSSNTSSNSSSAAQKSTKTFLCEIYCESASGPRITREVKAANRHEAATYMGDNANEICRGTGFSKASGRNFPDGQCREK